MKYFIILMAIICSGLNAQNLIQDPQFKLKNKHWTLKKKSEFAKVKPNFSDNLLTIETAHSSESFYLSLLTELDVKPGSKYKLTVSTKAEGEGQIRFTCVSRPKLDLKLKDIKVNRYGAIGLIKNVEPKENWEKHNFTFTTKKLISDEHRPYLSLQFGAYTGKVQIKDIELIEL